MSAIEIPDRQRRAFPSFTASFGLETKGKLERAPVQAIPTKRRNA
ncbi:hypothetical protein GEOBRER4_n0549 [Citrifermentans bremense]|uniref:Uncharacterized protein n=2 Tax=Geobacteraceae TaxID=213422 RepID=A0ABQ0ML20_9BACT|nr:hypothetical protein GEOBRER4_n0549 [Citrifermentans bremense]GAW67776.1 hypothetical protein GPEL0_01r3796 [Geoanaerobacter pelophilus]